MFDRNALGSPRRTRSDQNVSKILRCHIRIARRPLLDFHGGPIAIEVYEIKIMPGESLAEILLGEQDFRTRILKDATRTLFRVCRVKGDVRPPRLQDA